MKNNVLKDDVTSANKSSSVRNLLKTATGCLLGVTAVAGAQAASGEGWETDVALLYYSETDRVSALEPAIATKKTFDDDSAVGFKLVFDALTGASANGATASGSPQTFTRPSGNGTYTAGANETPLDDTFRDTRISLTANYEQPLENRMNKVVWGANVSNEYDFLSIGGSGTFMHDMNQRNTTLSLGFSFEQDSIKPVGGTPIPLGEMKAQGNQVRTGDESRSMVEMLVGVTQVIDSKTLVQFNYGLAVSDGYHNDAYKITSVVDSNGDNVASINLDGGSLNNRYLYENRPDSRTKHSVYGKVKRFIAGDVADISYRYMFDDWGVASSTVDMHYRFNVSPSWYVEPHVRYYSQQAADFYNTSLTEAQANTIVATNDDLTSDYRLGDMDATTVGLKFGFLTPDGNKSSIRVEYYNQTGTASQVIGNQSSQDLVPDVDAVIVQYNYSF